MNYKSFNDLNLAIKHWAIQLPKDFDLIVGIPRSGLLVANLLALYQNLPFTDVDGFINGYIFKSGKRGREDKSHFDKVRVVLVVDDSVCRGIQLAEVKNKLSILNNQYKIYYGAVYITKECIKSVDFWYEIVNWPRIFEWNIMHHSILSYSCVDIDGVICRDPKPDENDDGENYKYFINNVEPLWVPTKPVGWLVTCRLEKYRILTERWLKKNNIKYNTLIMMHYPNKETRMKARSYALFKAEVYKRVDAILFIESSYQQAVEIAAIAKKPVFCIETNQLIQPNLLIQNYYRSIKFIKKMINSPSATRCQLAKIIINKFICFLSKIKTMLYSLSKSD